MQAARSATLIRDSTSCSGFRKELMQGIKIGWIGRTFVMAVPQGSTEHQKHRRKRTKEERRIMVESFVHKYRASNKGQFPSLSATLKEVGGTFYVIREILRELIHEYETTNTLGTIGSLDKQTTMDTVKPLSLPAETSVPVSITMVKGAGHDHVLASEVENDPGVSLHTNDCRDINPSDIPVSCDLIDHTVVKQEKRMVEGLPEKIVMSKSMQPLQLMKTSCEEDWNPRKSAILGEKHNKECFGEHAVVSVETVMEPCNSSENQANCEFVEAQDQEIHPIQVKKSSAPLSDMSAGCRLESNTLEKQNAERNLEEPEVMVSAIREVKESCSASLENLNSFGDFEEKKMHYTLEPSIPVRPTLGLDKDGVDKETPLLDSTDKMLTEPESLAASVTSLSLRVGHIDTGKSADFQDDVLKDEQVSSIIVDKEQVLTGLEMQAVEICQRDSFKLLSENSDNLSSPSHADESSDNTGNAALYAIPDQDQVERVAYKKESTASNHNSVGISESINSSSSEISESPVDSLKLQKRSIWGDLKAIANGIVGFWKKI